jgi:hypothetical protein
MLRKIWWNKYKSQGTKVNVHKIWEQKLQKSEN